MDEDDIQRFLQQAEEEDIKNLKNAMNDLIDPITKFMNIGGSVETVGPEDFEDLMTALATAQFVVHGITYSYGFGFDCDHEHEEEDDA